MAVLEFEQLKFSENNDSIRVTFLDIFYFDILKEDLLELDEFTIKENSIEFKNISEKRASNKFNIILSRGFDNLKNKISGNKTVYIHRNSGIPLIGSNSFGLVDRDTDLIEIKPITSCNLNCIFCSVDEGKDTKKIVEFVVEKDYLVEQYRKIAGFKGCKPIYAYINVHGEPLLYKPTVELISDLKTVPGTIVGIITNGTLLNEKLIDELADAGLDRINISLSAMNEELADKLAGTKCNLKRLLELIKYANQKLEVVVAPVYMKGLNDEEMEDIIRFIKSIKRADGFPALGIQNFLSYKLGRNPVKETPWEEFEELLKSWEKKYDIDLHQTGFYPIKPSRKLSKPFKKGDIVHADIVCDDRYKDQKIAKCKGRSISLLKCNHNTGKKVKVRIVRDKHNIFVGEVV
jgi:uncharacterized Fe-S cluster-containing radical SAM superfamily enzyme